MRLPRRKRSKINTRKGGVRGNGNMSRVDFLVTGVMCNIYITQYRTQMDATWFEITEVAWRTISTLGETVFTAFSQRQVREGPVIQSTLFKQTSRVIPCLIWPSMHWTPRVSHFQSFSPTLYKARRHFPSQWLQSALETVKEQRFYFTFSQKLQTRTLQKQLFNLPEVSLTLTAFCMLISEDRTTSR